MSLLPHSLNLALTMSLVGTLHIPDSAPRTIICVSVSLAEGLQIWARDAQQAYAVNPPNSRIDATKGLPGGTYTLPLTVQVPSTPRLPPTFTVPDATFAVTYALSVTLTCDDPIRAGVRRTLAEASRPFEMMPETLPTRAPHYKPQSFWVPPSSTPNARWTIQPSLPTTAYSPTSIIPLSLKLTPPDAQRYQILLRLSLVRREHSSGAAKAFRDPLGQVGLIKEEELVSRYGWFESNSTDEINLSDVCLPLSLDQSWDRGFSTMLHVGPNDTAEQHISVSSTFHLAISMALLPLSSQSSQVLSDFFPLPPVNTFTTPQRDASINLSAIKRSFPGVIRTLPLPIVVGSVSEPRSAMHSFSWSDLHLDRSTGMEVGRVVEGAGVSCEDGWILAPPSYADAVKQAPYDF